MIRIATDNIRWLCLLFVLTAICLAQPAEAQLETSVAIMPLIGDQNLNQSQRETIYRQLAGPLKAREDYSISMPKSDDKATVTPEETGSLIEYGAESEADLLVLCRLRSVDISGGYDFSIYLFDVNGKAMLAQEKGSCPGHRDGCMASQTKKLYGGPFPLGIDTEPTKAGIVSNGEDWGKTPMRRLLGEGSYTLLISKEGYKSMEVEFEMPSDRPVYATIPLEADPDYVAPLVTMTPPPMVLGLGGSDSPEAVKPPVSKPPRRPIQKAPPEPPRDLPKIPSPVAEKEAEGEVETVGVTTPEQIERQSIEPPTVTSDEEPMSTRRVWAWRTVGISAATAAAGLGLTFAALHSDDRSSDQSLLADTRKDYADRRDNYWIASYTFYGLTGAAIATALVLFFTEPEDEPAVSVAPLPLVGGVGVTSTIRY